MNMYNYREKRKRFTCKCCKYKERSVRTSLFIYCPECGARAAGEKEARGNDNN